MLKINELIVDLYECKSSPDDMENLSATLESAVDKVGTRVIQRTTQKFSPTGVSVIFILAETHISLHTWPEYGYAALDIFICGEGKDPEIAWEVVRKALRPKSFKINRIARTISIDDPLVAKTQIVPVGLSFFLFCLLRKAYA